MRSKNYKNNICGHGHCLLKNNKHLIFDDLLLKIYL